MTTAPILYAVRNPTGEFDAPPRSYEAASMTAQMKAKREPGKLFVLYRYDPVEFFQEVRPHVD